MYIHAVCLALDFISLISCFDSSLHLTVLNKLQFPQLWQLSQKPLQFIKLSITVGVML